VRAIDNDCASLPVGALKLTPSHELRQNESFKGLNTHDALELKNYQHFRPPTQEDVKEFISISFHFNNI
jgi:radial spoke head protein 9